MANEAAIALATATVLIGMEETAALLDVPVATLRWLRHQGKGPVGFPIAGRIKFKRDEVLRYIDEQHEAAIAARSA